MVDGGQQGPAHQEPLAVDLVLAAAGSAGLGRPQVQELAGVVPLVDGLGHVDALVALQPQQLAARPGGQHLGHLGLAHPGLALEQQRAVQGQGQEDRRGQALVGQVAVGGEGAGDLLDGERVWTSYEGHRFRYRCSRSRPPPARVHGPRHPAPACLLQRPPHQHLGQVAAVLGAGVEVRGRIEPVGGVGGRLGAEAPPASASSTALARRGTGPMLTSATPGVGPVDRGHPDDGPVLGPPVELLERPARPVHLRHPDLGQHLVGLQGRLQEADGRSRWPAMRRSPLGPHQREGGTQGQAGGRQIRRRVAVGDRAADGAAVAHLRIPDLAGDVGQQRARGGAGRR